MPEKYQSLESLSDQDFLAFGVNDVAYVRTVSPEVSQEESGNAYGIFAADGTQMAVVASRDLAFAAVRQHDMEPLSVH